MAVLINFKICDNSKDCYGIEVCPTGAFYWNDKRKTITVNDKKCISCGKCQEACHVGAIRIARTKKECERIKREIKEDPRKTSDLFVDRYGAELVGYIYQAPLGEFNIQILEATKLTVAELFSRNSIECLLYSIPIRELFKNRDVKYRKIEVKESDSTLKKYKVKDLPSLLFFRNGKLIGKIEGYYDIRRKKDFLSKINRILAGKRS